MPERSRAPSRGRRAWSMRDAWPGSHPAGRARAGPSGGGAEAWSESAGALDPGSSEAPEGRRILRAGLGAGTWSESVGGDRRGRRVPALRRDPAGRV